MEPTGLAGVATAAVLFLALFAFESNIATSLADGHLGGGGGGEARRSMVLPLFLSRPNSSSTFSNLHRHLQAKYLPNARMRLYDDLLLNGYYTTRLWIGTPPQSFALIVDTGSTVTYVPCSTCEQCGNHQDPKFQPELSSTYQPVNCNNDCTCDDEKGQCIYERQYAESSTSSGVLGEDTVSFGNESELSPQRVIFGCENVETGDLYSQRADGIMGLGRGDLSVVDQLVDKDAISDAFALCYGGMDVGGGAMILGGLSSPSDMVFANSDRARSPYYNIDLKEIHVAGKPLPLNPRVFDGKHGTILDSGTTYAYLPRAAFNALSEAITKELSLLRRIDGPDPNYRDICFSGATSDVSKLSKNFPAVEMVFGSGQKLLLSPENYLFRHSKVRGAYCLGIFENGNDQTTLLGGIIVRNTLVLYDREHAKIGFSKINCSELWEKLHPNGLPPPLPSSPNGNGSSYPGNNSTNNSSASVLPGENQIREITFEMSMNTSYSYLKSQITELAALIAKELNVNASQVRLLNLTSEGNGSLVRWTILPLGSVGYISKDTAMSIISRLDEHQIHIPDRFGTYQLVEWHVMPPVKRTWWELHYLAVIISISVFMILALLASGVWLILRHRQSLNRYEPVDGAVGEQELQPI